MKQLMIFSIGPVQDFIATARRSRDLWYGSWMLSELARAAAKAVAENSGSLIFPSDPENIVSVPNKIVSAITTDNPKSFAEKIEKAVNTYIKTLANETLDSIKLTPENRLLAIEQIEDVSEVYWVSVPYDDNYASAREEAEALLAARKVTRNFKLIKGGNVPKSSLDGSRESVIDESEYPPKKKYGENTEAWEKVRDQKIRKLYDNYHARQGERLSGVDLLKRMGKRSDNDEPDFKSTSHMAAIPFMEKLGKDKTKVLVDAIRKLFDDAGWNIGEKDEGALLYESRLTDWIPSGKEQDKLRKEFNDLFTTKYKLGESRPDAYYALLRADGDNMGVVIYEQKDEEKHRELSKALSGFAAQVKSIINENHNGLLIYSGGDDVLAYLPINKVLDCASELEEEFRKSLEDFSATKKVDGKDIPIEPTLSIGIVIAHHLDPLSDVLAMAHDAEKKAKEVEGKNGLAITLSKRSGVDRTIMGKWADLSARLTQLIEFSNTGAISGGTAYELHDLHRTLAGHIPDEGLAAEAMRIVKHKQESGGEKIIDKENGKKSVENTFKQWFALGDEKKLILPLDELANEMIIAKALADTVEPTKVKEEANT